MKIDGITLLQMIKEGKIKENTLIEVSGGTRTHYPYIRFSKNKRLYWENKDSSISQAVLTDDLLEYEFEIIEEKPEKIEPLELVNFSKFKEMNPEERYLITAKEYDKLEELRLAFNYLLERSDKDEC